jgi:hypothetical protein
MGSRIFTTLMARPFILCALLLLGACATPPSPPKTQISSIRSVQIVSAIGSKISLQALGTRSGMQWLLNAYGFGLDKNIERVSVQNWAIDDFVAKLSTDLIGGCFDIKETPDKALAARLEAVTVHGANPDNMFGGDDARGVIEKAVREEAPAEPPDAYIVVVRDEESFYPNPSFSRTSGLGLIHVAGLLSQEDDVFALYRLYLVGSREDRVLAAATALLPGQSPRTPFDGPLREVADSWWADSFKAMTDTQKEQLRIAIDDLIAQSLPNTLFRLGLRCSNPPGLVGPAARNSISGDKLGRHNT